MAELFSGISDTLMDGIQAILYATIYKLLYYIAVGCCWIVNLLYSMFEIMAGLSKVSYDGDYNYLINVFFSNTTVSKVYWGMALIGLTAGFAFAIAAVIKKLFDLSEKEKRSYGQILRGLFKSSLTILCMSLIITMVLNATTLLMQQINYVFINADDLGEEQSITYTDEEYAAMTRALSTIGNFSLNPSYNNRFNLNKCFNEIRLDLQYLEQHGVFDFHYVTKDMEGNTIATWQSVLQKIANSASLERDLSLDVYHESVSNSILQAMDLLKVNGSFKPLEEYQRHYQPSRTSLPMDRFLFLMASMRAAKNDDYNKNPSLTDPLRGAYYYGEKSIYDLDAVNEDFDIGVAAFDYLVLLLICYKMLETLATIILNCVGRIFNMLLLYLISPLVIAVSSLDDGAKFKQWTTAFIVQSFSVFGTVISMRVLLLFIPIIIDNKLVLFENILANLFTKLVIILGAFEVAEKATNLITGILADNAGWQSITAGDMSSAAKTAVGYGLSAAKGAGGMGLSAVGLGMKGGLKAAGLGVKAAAGVGIAAGYGAYGAAKLSIAGGKAIAGKISAWRNSGKNDGAGGGGTGGTGTDGTANDAGGGGTGGTGTDGTTNDNGGNQQTDDLPTNQHNTTDFEANGTGINTQSNTGPTQPQVPPQGTNVAGGGNQNGVPGQPQAPAQGTNMLGGGNQNGVPGQPQAPAQGTNVLGGGNQNGVLAQPQVPPQGTNVAGGGNRNGAPAQPQVPPQGTNMLGGGNRNGAPAQPQAPAQGTNMLGGGNRNGAPAQPQVPPQGTNVAGGGNQNGAPAQPQVPPQGTNVAGGGNRNGVPGQPQAPAQGTNMLGGGNRNGVPGQPQAPSQGTNVLGGGNQNGAPAQPQVPPQGTNVVGGGNQINGVPAQPQAPVQIANVVGGGNQTGTATIAKDAPYTPSAGIQARAQAIENAQAAAAASINNVAQQQRPSRPIPKAVRNQNHNNNT